MRIYTRSRDMAAHIQKLEDMLVVMAIDISNLLHTADSNICSYTAKEIIENYDFVTSKPSIIEEILHEQNGTPYLERESILAYLIKTGVVVRDEYIKG